MIPYFFEQNLFSIARQLAELDQKEKNFRARKESFADSGIHQSTSSFQEDFDIEKEVYHEMVITRQLPFRDYVCHRCHVPGHMIQFCPTKNAKNEKTPYQGDRPSVGRFNCPSCCRSWNSENIKANTSKECRTCGTAVFPSKMWPMKKFFF